MSTLRSSSYALAVTALSALHGMAQEPPRSAEEPTEILIKRVLQDLDAENYDVRERATTLLKGRVANDLQLENPPSHDANAPVLERFFNSGNVSPEQRWRLAAVLHFASTRSAELPTILPKRSNISGTDILTLLQRGRTKIKAEDSTLERLNAEKFDLDEHRDFGAVLEMLCKRCSAFPEKQENGTILLRNAGTPVDVAVNELLVATMKESKDGSPPTMSIFMEPSRGEILNLMNGIGEGNDADPCIRLNVASAGRGWTSSTSTSINTCLSPFRAKGVRATVAINPTEQVMKYGDPQRIGFQMITPVLEQTPEGNWTTTIHGTVFGWIPWPKTPLNWDMLTYQASSGNRYTLFDEDGEEMSALVTPQHFDERKFSLTLHSTRKPSRMKVRAWTDIGEVETNLPAFAKKAVAEEPAQAEESVETDPK